MKLHLPYDLTTVFWMSYTQQEFTAAASIKLLTSIKCYIILVTCSIIQTVLAKKISQWSKGYNINIPLEMQKSQEINLT